jgi:uncharacterized protein with PQ loop repeat
MEINLPIIAGTISTTVFACSTLPMLLKAFRTKEMKSYSLGNILLANVGNLIHSVYVFNLPPGPIWLLHTFYLVTTGLMLVWYLRYEMRPGICWQRFQVQKRVSKQISQVIPQLHAPVHKQEYPTGIPHSGHDGAFPWPYTSRNLTKGDVKNEYA